MILESFRENFGVSFFKNCESLELNLKKNQEISHRLRRFEMTASID